MVTSNPPPNFLGFFPATDETCIHAISTANIADPIWIFYKWSRWSDFIDWIYVNTTRARLRHRELPKDVKPTCRCLPLTNYSGWLFLYCRCLFRNLWSGSASLQLDISHLTQADRHPRWSTESLIHGAYREILCPEGSRASNSNWERVIMLVSNKHQNDFNIFTVSYSSLDQGPRVKHPLLNRRQLSLPPPRSCCLFIFFYFCLKFNSERFSINYDPPWITQADLFLVSWKRFGRIFQA